MNTCLGLCCQGFTLYEPEVSQHKDMLIPTGNKDRYGCKNWDLETHLCKIYETRPKMCQDFPEAWLHKKCYIEGCTFQETEPHKE